MLDVVAEGAGVAIVWVGLVTVASLKLVDRVDARRHAAENPSPPTPPPPPDPTQGLTDHRLALSKRRDNAWPGSEVRTHYEREIAEVDRQLERLRRTNG